MAASGRGRRVATRDFTLELDRFADAGSLGDGLARLEGRSVLLAVGDMAKAAAALIELDGVARRIVLCPPGAGADALVALARAAEADALVYDGDAPAPEIDVATRVACRLPLAPLAAPRAARFVTEWAMPTSGTSGPPKLVAHTLATLTAAFRPVAGQRWATFYDIRRYGGLQILLRALLGAESLTLSDPSEGVDAFLVRLGEARRDPHFRHAVALAQSADERRSAPHRAAARAPLRRDRRRRGARRPSRALSERACRTCLCVDRGGRRLRRLRRARGLSRRLRRRGRRGRAARRRRRRCAFAPIAPRCAISAPTRRR